MIFQTSQGGICLIPWRVHPKKIGTPPWLPTLWHWRIDLGLGALGWKKARQIGYGVEVSEDLKGVGDLWKTYSKLSKVTLSYLRCSVFFDFSCHVSWVVGAMRLFLVFFLDPQIDFQVKEADEPSQNYQNLNDLSLAGSHSNIFLGKKVSSDSPSTQQKTNQHVALTPGKPPSEQSLPKSFQLKHQNLFHLQVTPKILLMEEILHKLIW